MLAVLLISFWALLIHYLGPLLKKTLFTLLYHHLVFQTLKDTIALLSLWSLLSDGHVIKQQPWEIFLQSLGSANPKQLT